MRRTRWAAAAIAAAAVGSTLSVAVPATLGTASAANGTVERFVVLYAQGASLGQARAAVKAAGGTILSENKDVKVAVVATTSAAFRVAAGRQKALAGVARDRYIGYAPPPAPTPSATATATTGSASRLKAAQRRTDSKQVEKDVLVAGGTSTARTARAATGTVGTEPLSSRQWDMRMIHATEAQRVQPGDRRVLVGVIDTGVDGSHPDIAPNFNKALSRNFVRDIPTDPAGGMLDGPCEVPSCVDPVDEDDNEHGTHVASTIASPVNGTGIAGVAPNVQIVNIRAGQDSGYFFLMPTLDAISYAGRAGVDVVNMSFYTDPWLFNCTANPADSPAEQEEQRTIITATQRAVDFAYGHGVTLVSAAGNENTDLGKPGVDETSPDYPQATDSQEFAKPRTIDNKTCLSVPTESNHVLAVSALGPSTRLSYYSNYGTERIDVAAPGGDSRDTTTGLTSPTNTVLAAAPENVLKASGALNPDGSPKTASVVRDGGAYYQYLQGTSMAAPHAAGVAALIVSQYGTADGKGGFGLSPARVAQYLTSTATEKDCPEPATVEYRAGYRATCEGGLKFNGFYGHGIVDALTAVKSK